MAQSGHHSCLLLTSREKPTELPGLEGRKTPVRSLRLDSLEASACEQLLAEHELVGSPEERVRLIERYGGNPLALNIVAQTIADLDHPETLFWGLAWSPDGKLLAGATDRRGVLLWKVTAGSGRWIGRELPIWSRRVAFSPDGTRLVAGGDDRHVYVWDASDGTLLQRLAGHDGAIMSVAFSPDGTRLASAGGSDLLVWEVHSGAGVRALAGHPGVASAVTWEPSGERLLSGGADGMLRWWDLHSGECVRVHQAHQGTVWALKVSPEGQRLASCGDDGAITLWDLERGEPLRTLRRDRPYERLNITGIRGLTEAEVATLRALGAVEDEASPSPEQAAQR